MADEAALSRNGHSESSVDDGDMQVRYAQPIFQFIQEATCVPSTTPST